MKFLKRHPFLRLLLIVFGLWLGYWVVRGGYAAYAFRTAVAHYKAGRYGAATREFTNTLNAAPVDDGDIRFWRANSLGLSGRVTEALVDFRKAVELEPKEVRYVEGLAYALWITGRREESIRVQRTAIELSPGDVELRMVLGIRLWRLRAPRSEVLRELRAALEIEPSNEDVHKLIEGVNSGRQPRDDKEPGWDRSFL